MGKKYEKKKNLDDKKRNYGNDFLSVTEVLQVLRKPALEYWFKMHSKDECEKLSKKAKIIGTQIHSLIEMYIKGEKSSIKTKFPDEVNRALKSFLLFKKDYPHLELIWAEKQITDEEIFLNGTIDCIGKQDGNTIIIDWKTGECKNSQKPKIYFEFLLQLAAYWHIFNWFNEGTLQTKYAYIVVLAKDKIAYNIEKVSDEDLSSLFTIFYYLKNFLENKILWQQKKRKEKKNVEIKNEDNDINL